VAPLQEHPGRSAISGKEGEDLRPAEVDGLEYQQLAGEVCRRNDMGPDAELVQRRVFRPEARIDADDARQEGVDAHQAGSERRDLILGLLGVLPRRRSRLHHRGAIVGLPMVGDKLPVVDAARVVQRREVLERIANGDDTDLGLA
jgi:hypothetical protein